MSRLEKALKSHVNGKDVRALVGGFTKRGQTEAVVLGSAHRDSIFRVASMTKPVTGVATLMLIEDKKLGFDDPVERFLPELANRRVLKKPDAALDDTVPARRAITVRDLLTFTMGFGMEIGHPETPVERAEKELGTQTLGPPVPATTHPPDEWMRRLGTLPLMYQPGERWLYNTPAQVLGVLIARVARQPLEAFFEERIFAPLGMKDTAFSVPAAKRARLGPVYQGNGEVWDPADGQFVHPPVFPDAAAGLVSTFDDFLAFGHMLVEGGGKLLSRASIEAMTRDQVTPAQRAGAQVILDDHGWGYCISVEKSGHFGWDGGLGTSFKADFKDGMAGVLLTDRGFDSPTPPGAVIDFWKAVDEA